MLFFTLEMIQELLFLVFPLFLSCAVADTFRPTKGEIILGNVTYEMTWSFDLPYTSCYGILFSLANMVPPSYTTGLGVRSRKFSRGISSVVPNFLKLIT